MKHTSKKFKALLGGGLVLLLVSVLAGHAVAQDCVEPPEGLVSWWPGDGNPNDIIDANHGTLQGGAAFAPGMVDQAFSLDGVDDYIRVPHNNSLDLSVFTIDAWIRPQAFSVSSIVQKGGLGATEDDFHNNYRLLTNVDGRIWGRIGDTTRDFTIQSTNPLVLNQWQHVALTYDGSFLRLFVDAAEAAPALPVSITPYFSPSDLVIGRYDFRSTPFGHFNGLIDEVEIYNRALTAEEIQEIFDAGSAGKCKVVSFTDFTANVEIELGPLANDDEFEVKGAFTLGTDSDGINPLTEIVSLELSGGGVSFSVTIPTGLFEFRPAKPGKNGKPGKPADFRFEGVIDGVALEVKIIDLGVGMFEFKAEGTGADLTGMANPVTVSLTIGDDGGSTMVEAEFE